MATLTSTGVNCSNGTLDGYYTGTTIANTSYPIGSYIFVGMQNYTSEVSKNASSTIYTSNSNAQFQNNNSNSGSVVAGTWRARGMAYTIFNCAPWWTGLYQRVA